MSNAKMDENSRQTLTALSSVDGVTIVDLWADPTTHALLVDDGGASITVLAATGDIDDSNVTFTFTSVPTLVCINGLMYTSTSTVGGTLAWTNVSTTVTLAFPVGSGGSIYGL